MHLTSLSVHGFRSLASVDIDFDPGITVLVGENDAGKTSVMRCIDLAVGIAQPEAGDVTHGHATMEISLRLDGVQVTRQWRRNDGHLEAAAASITLTEPLRQALVDELEADTFDIDDPDCAMRVRDVASLVGIVIRANSNMQNVKARVIEALQSDADTFAGSVEHLAEIIRLDGRQLDDASQFFDRLFMTDLKRDIWAERLDDGATILEHVARRVDEHATAVSTRMNDGDALGHLRTFLPRLEAVRVHTEPQHRDLQFATRFMLVENGREVDLSSKGDGTKRRVTMALLELRRRLEQATRRTSTYVFDEPDTHLHASAQVDMFETLRGFTASGHQVIVTTHSPFLLNAVPAHQVRLLGIRESHTRVRRIDDGEAQRVLSSLGIENTHLFFARHVVLVEGPAEEAFLNAFWASRLHASPQASLIKIVSTSGVQNIPGFATALAQLHEAARVFVLYDADSIERIQPLVDRLGLPSDNVFVVGENEFEDAFQCDTLARCWSEAVTSNGQRLAPGWTANAIEACHRHCLSEGRKFSTALRVLNAGGSRKMTKPALATALGRHAQDAEIPPVLRDLCTRLLAAARRAPLAS